MLELPLPHREIIALCDLEELPYHTVAAILDCPIGTVRSRLHRARALLTIRLASLELIELQTNCPSRSEPHMTETLHPQVAALIERLRARSRHTTPSDALDARIARLVAAPPSKNRAARRLSARLDSGRPRPGSRCWPSPPASSSACGSSAARGRRTSRSRRATWPPPISTCGPRIRWRSRFPPSFRRRARSSRWMPSQRPARATGSTSWYRTTARCASRTSCRPAKNATRRPDGSRQTP